MQLEIPTSELRGNLGVGGLLEGNFGTGVRPSFLKPIQIIYLVLKK